MAQSEPSITVYYNGACAICGPEVALYRRLATEAEAAIEFVDISGSCPRNMDQTALLQQFHVKDTDGTLKIGLDGFVVLWRQLPKFRWLARVTALPGVRHIGQAIYLRVIAPWLYRSYLKQIAK